MTVFMVGIKGTGMTSLALYLSRNEDVVYGWDTDEVFPTDELLQRHSISCSSSTQLFSFTRSIDILIHSSAYDETHPLIREAGQNGIPIYSYHEYLGRLTEKCDSYGIAGTHGKTTACGCIDTLLTVKHIPHSAIYGSSLIGQPEESSIFSPDKFILESCEYKKHFLSYRLKGLLITNIEWEHVDYYEDFEAVISTFIQRVEMLPISSFVVINNDDTGAKKIIRWIRENRDDLTLLTYGKEEKSDIVYSYPYHDDLNRFEIVNTGRIFPVSLTGDHFVSDIVASAIFSQLICNGHVPDMNQLDAFFGSVSRFKGCSGRLERIDHPQFILYRDYAHHPSEIASSLASLRALYPQKRFHIIFIPHTIGRTVALFDRFVEVLTGYDSVFILPVAASARFRDSHEVSVRESERLAAAVKGKAAYSEEHLQNMLKTILHQNDVCVTMGAGNTLPIIESIMKIKGHK